MIDLNSQIKLLTFAFLSQLIRANLYGYFTVDFVQRVFLRAISSRPACAFSLTNINVDRRDYINFHLQHLLNLIVFLQKELHFDGPAILFVLMETENHNWATAVTILRLMAAISNPRSAFVQGTFSKHFM